MSAMFEVRDLRVLYGGHPVVEIPRLTIEEGEVLAIIGPNGSGKSTLLRVLALLEKPAEGQVCFKGQPINYKRSLLPYRRRLALVMQHPILRNTSTFENAATGLRFRHLPEREVKRRVSNWLNKLGIAHLDKRNAHTLSGGESQRACLARALSLEPDLLLLDEPFAALDEPSRVSLIDDLQNILNEVSVTTVFVTHDRSEALIFGKKVAVMMGGRIQQLGTPEEVFSKPSNEAVAAFVGADNIISGLVSKAQNGLVSVDAHEREIVAIGSYAVGERLVLCIRPEDVVIEPYSSAAPITSARNKLKGRVVRCTPLGPQYRVVLDCDFPLVSLISKQSFQELSLVERAEVIASFKASGVHIIGKRV